MRRLTVSCVVVGFAMTANPAAAQTGVACVGDSITQNSGWCDDLGTLLGANYDAVNFGLSGTTLLKAGDHPYWGSTQYTQSHDFGPGIVIIMLGTNDSKPQNWVHKDQFVGDYEELIDTYRALPSAPKIYLNLPPPAGVNGFAIDGTVIENEVLPLVRQVAAAKHTGLIDIFTAFGGHDFDPSLYGSAGDQVHPNGAGAQRIADTVYAALIAPPPPDAGADAAADAAVPVQDAALPLPDAGGETSGGGGGSGGEPAGSGGNGAGGGALASGGSSVGGNEAAAGSSSGASSTDSSSKSDSGCSCNLARAPQTSATPWLILAGVVLLTRRRRGGPEKPSPK